MKRLVLHGERNIVRFEVDAEGDMSIELFGSTAGNGLAAVTIDPEEIRQLHEFTKPKPARAGKKARS